MKAEVTLLDRALALGRDECVSLEAHRASLGPQSSAASWEMIGLTIADC